MEQNNVDTDVLVVGAGLSGLMAANVLRDSNLQVMLVDKGRSVGGRLATRRIGGGKADHGAQFFTVRSPSFKAWVDDWRAAGLVYCWSTGWNNGSLDAGAKPVSDSYPRYAVHGGMNALAKYLAQNLNVAVNVKLMAISSTKTGWKATDEHGQIYTAKAIILTPPVPQSLMLLAEGKTMLAPENRSELKRIHYAPCVAGMFVVNGQVDLPEPGAIQQPDAVVSWIADNRRKGISPDATVITMHAGPDFSEQLWALPDNEAIDHLQSALAPYLEDGAEIEDVQIKRWRYALPIALYHNRFLHAANLPPLIFAGDAFGGPRVEGAALSGLTAGERMMEISSQ